MFKADTFPQDCRFGAMKSTLCVLWCSLQADVGHLFLPGVVRSPADDQGFGILLPGPCGARLVAGGLALLGVSAGLGKKTAFLPFSREDLWMLRGTHLHSFVWVLALKCWGFNQHLLQSAVWGSSGAAAGPRFLTARSCSNAGPFSSCKGHTNQTPPPPRAEPTRPVGSEVGRGGRAAGAVPQCRPRSGGGFGGRQGGRFFPRWSAPPRRWAVPHPPRRWFAPSPAW